MADSCWLMAWLHTVNYASVTLEKFESLTTNARRSWYFSSCVFSVHYLIIKIGANRLHGNCYQLTANSYQFPSRGVFPPKQGVDCDKEVG